MKYRISTSNERVWCTTRLAKLNFNHSIGRTHSWRFPIFNKMKCCRISPSNHRICCITQLAKLSLNHSIGRSHSWRFSISYNRVRKYVFKKLPFQKLSRRQYLRYIFLKGKNVFHRRWVLIKSCGIFCLSVSLAYNAPSICPRQNGSATAYTAPNKQDGPNRTSTAVCTAAAQAMNARRIERVVPEHDAHV